MHAPAKTSVPLCNAPVNRSVPQLLLSKRPTTREFRAMNPGGTYPLQKCPTAKLSKLHGRAMRKPVRRNATSFFRTSSFFSGNLSFRLGQAGMVLSPGDKLSEPAGVAYPKLRLQFSEDRFAVISRNPPDK